VGAAAVAAASGRLRRYVFTSSVAVYPPGGEYEETGPLVPADYPNPYAAQKAESERALFELQQSRGIPVTALRPAFVYGPHNAIEREAFFWDRIVAGRPIIVPEDGRRAMQWVHADDVARAAILAADNHSARGQAYNLAGYPPITQVEFVRLLGRVAGRETKVLHIPRDLLLKLGGQLMAPPLYFGSYLDVEPIVVRNDRARTGLGLEFTPLEEGLRDTYRWYRSQQRPGPDFSWEDQAIKALSGTVPAPAS
jgi:nucleoside-diphosphate-sugar epimerase